MSELDDYVERLPIETRVIRMSRREGLIRARLKGADEAAGPVLVFFDAHVEVTEGWLPPIVAEILQDRSRVVMPIVDDIDDETFEVE